MPDSDSDNGLICAYAVDPRGVGKALDWRGVDNWSPDQGLLWVHLDFTEAGSRQWLEQKSGLDSNIVDALLADEGRPRSMQQGDGWLVMLRGVNTNRGAEPDDMVAVRVWLEPGRIISTRRRRLQSMQDIRSALDSGKGPATAGGFLVALLDGLTQRISEAVDNLEEQIEGAESRTSNESSLVLQMQIADLRRQCARLRRHLSAQRDALEQLVRQGGAPFTKDDVRMVREAGDQIIRALEDLDLARERAMVAHEEFVARVAQEQNARVYLLSIVAAIFLPLGFLTGLFGMNVAGLPGLEDPDAFMTVSGIMLGLAVIALIIFRFKRWI